MKKKILVVLAILIVTTFTVSTAFAAGIKSINGGGQIIEAPDGTKRPEWAVISFGGWAQAEGTTITGEWQVNFHNVNDVLPYKSTYHTTDIREFNYYESDSDTCLSAMNMTTFGTFNGVDNYKLIFRAGDFGSPGFVDTVRIQLYDPSGTPVYDTSGPFTNESSCVGSARTGLDAGNITITYEEYIP